MLDSLVSALFWTTFSFSALAATVLLLGVISRSSRLYDAFRCVDDQSTDPDSVSNQVCEISQDSGALGIHAYVLLLPLLGSLCLAAFSVSVPQSFAAIAMADSVLFAAVHFKRRQDAFDEAFRLRVGSTVMEVASANEEPYPRLSARPRRSARPSR